MRISYSYSHLGGLEIIQACRPEQHHELEEAIAAIDARCARPQGGPGFCTPNEIEALFRRLLAECHYQRLAEEPYAIALHPDAETLPGDSKTIEHVKEGVMVEVGLDKTGRLHEILFTFSHWINQERAEVGVMIIPCSALRERISGNGPRGEQLIHDMRELQWPNVPVWVILVDAEDEDA